MSTPEFTSADAYWDQIGPKILGVVEDRIDNGETDKLPGTLLMRLAEQYLKYLEKKAAEAEGEEDEYLTPLQAIDQEGLPHEAKLEILQGYITQLEADHTAATERMKELLVGDA